MATAFCLDCEHIIEMESLPPLGKRIKCPNCEVQLEVINLNPLELDWVYDGPANKPGFRDTWWPSSHQEAHQST
jgi:hypothetical protein